MNEMEFVFIQWGVPWYLDCNIRESVLCMALPHLFRIVSRQCCDEGVKIGCWVIANLLASVLALQATWRRGCTTCR